MRDFNRDRRNDGPRDFKRREFGSGSSDRPQVMHKTICSKCGKECEVPFKPNGSKPVYCRDCFQTMRDGGPARSDNFSRRPSFDDRNSGPTSRPVEQSSPNYQNQFEALNTKLDKILNMLSTKDTVSQNIISEEAPILEVEIPIIKKRKSAKK